ncbi:MAG: YfiR family protein [Kofleriaceae bacterium]|nr:MAG: YfiR family protein [Kofleriaceae bacterium]MBZ0232782.1 YfiR family protein [Kofleriaceae bacterium]
MGVRLAMAALAVGLCATSRAAAADPTEAELKAEMVERFTRFIDWNADDLPPDTLALCVVGESPLTRPLERIARSRKIKDRRAAVRVVDAPATVDCHIVVIGGNDRKRLAAVVARTEGHGILTIADAPGAAAAGAIINFYLDAEHVRFEINTRAARDSGLKVRAKLLRLARVVGGKP